MHPTTSTIEGKKARQAIQQGIAAIYQPVRKSIGPFPRKALIFRTYSRGPRIVDDGHIIAEAQEPKNPFVRQVAQTFKEACKRTNELVGDGTATTAVVGGALSEEVFALTEDSSSAYNVSSKKGKANLIKTQILSSARVVKEAIKKSAKKIESLEDLEKIAIVSVGDTELGKIIAGMAWKAGVDGFVDVVEGFKGEIETEMTEGFRFAAKPAAKAFVNNPNRYELVTKDSAVLITNYALDNDAEVGQLFAKLYQSGLRKCTIIAPSFGDQVLLSMVQSIKNNYILMAVKVPSLRTEQFEDLALYCGASFIDKNKGRKLSTVGQHDLGFVEKLIVKDTENREDAVALGGQGTKFVIPKDKQGDAITTPIQDRIKILKEQLAETKDIPFKKLLERRIASMASSIGVIKVSDSTQASSLDKKLKIEDAVYACKSALRGGYIKGGGLCLFEISKTLADDDVLKKAIAAPYEEIQNSVEGGISISDDILDPAEASLYAVEHATGVIANLITVDTITIEGEDVSPTDASMLQAKAMIEVAIGIRRYFGQIKEGEEEMMRDRLSGLTIDEKVQQDNG